MKKSLASIVAFVVLLFSASANAGQIASANASGHPGETVNLDVSLAAGDITYGGDFTVTFDSTRLTFKEIIGGNGLDACCFDSSFPLFQSGSKFSLAQSIFDPAFAPIDPIFSIWFTINDPYPTSDFPDLTYVEISGYFFDVDSTEVQLDRSITPTITVDANSLPEPGVLGLTGLALLIMTVVGRRRRVNRG